MHTISAFKCKDCRDKQYICKPGPNTAKAFLCKCAAVCKKCNNTGYYFMQDELERDIAYPCECAKNNYKINLFNAAGIPGRFFDATFDNFEIKQSGSLKKKYEDIKFKVNNYSPSHHQSFLFMGPVGVGKTRLVCSMVHHYIFELGVPCLFQEFSNLLSEIKAGYDKGKSESSLLEPLNNIDILVIDELGKGRKSDWEINILDTIVSHRYNLGKTTIFTTNYTDKKETTYTESHFSRQDNMQKETKVSATLKERIHTRIYSRLKEMCEFYDFCDLKDFRTREVVYKI